MNYGKRKQKSVDILSQNSHKNVSNNTSGKQEITILKSTGIVHI